MLNTVLLVTRILEKDLLNEKHLFKYFIQTDNNIFTL